MAEEFKYRPRDDGSQGHDVGEDMAVKRALHESAERMIAAHDDPDGPNRGPDYQLTLEDLVLRRERSRKGWGNSGLPYFKSNDEALDVLVAHVVELEEQVTRLFEERPDGS